MVSNNDKLVSNKPNNRLVSNNGPVSAEEEFNNRLSREQLVSNNELVPNRGRIESRLYQIDSNRLVSNNRPASVKVGSNSKPRLDEPNNSPMSNKGRAELRHYHRLDPIPSRNTKRLGLKNVPGIDNRRAEFRLCLLKLRLIKIC